MAHLPDLKQLARSEHGFETNIGKGRLTLRSIQLSEVQIYHTIRSDPQNNHFQAYPDPELKADDLKKVLEPAWREGGPIFQLFVILKDKQVLGNQELAVKEGTVVGMVEVDKNASKKQKHHRTAEVGIVIHHPFAGEKYGKEALIALFDYSFLCKAKILRGTYATGLELDEIVLDTVAQNVYFVSRMTSLGLGGLRKQSTHVQLGRPQEKSFTWTLEKKHWKEKRGNVRMGWLKPPIKLEKMYMNGASSVDTTSQAYQSGHQQGQHYPDQTKYQYWHSYFGMRELSLRFEQVRHTDLQDGTILVWKQSNSLSSLEQTYVQYGSTNLHFQF